MLARTSLRQVVIVARVSPARAYTSSTKEGSVAASKEFGYVSVAIAASTSAPSEAHKQIPLSLFSRKKEKAHEGMCPPKGMFQ